MRALDFTRSLDYRKIATAIFADGAQTYEKECVICEDYDEDEDYEYRWYRSLTDLETDEDLVDIVSIRYANGCVA